MCLSILRQEGKEYLSSEEPYSTSRGAELILCIFSMFQSLRVWKQEQKALYQSTAVLFQSEFLLACCSSLTLFYFITFCGWTDLLQIQYFFISWLKGKLFKPIAMSHIWLQGLFAKASTLEVSSPCQERELAKSLQSSASPAQAVLSHFGTSWRMYFENHKTQVWRTGTFFLYP